MKKVYTYILALLFLLCSVETSYSQINRKIDSLYKLLRIGVSDEQKVAIYIKLGARYEGLGLFDSTLKYSRKGLSLARKFNIKKSIASSSNFLGHCFSYSGNHDSAFYYYDISFKNFTIVKDSGSIAGLYNNLGILYVKEGNISKGLDNYYKSLKLKEQMHDTDGIANACQNIGNLYSETRDTANCLKYHLRALELRRMVKDTAGIANTYIALGLYYLKFNDFEKALDYLTKSYVIEEKIGDEESIAIVSYNMGNIFYEQGKYSESEKYFLKALEIARKDNIKEGVSTCLKALGNVNEHNGKLKEAIKYYEEAYKVAKDVQILELQTNISENLSTAYEKIGDFKSSLKFHKEWIKYRDSIYSGENLKKIASAELKYEHEKERLLMQAEQQRKEAESQQKNLKKNIVIVCSVIFIIIASLFAFVLFKRLQENRKQKAIIEQQNHEILDSIKYAKQIQNTLFANKDFINKYLPDNFILFKPKDIVSGDFYWATSVTGSLLHVPGSEQITINKKTETDNSELFFLAVCDSTGHGVPGAFMSLLNIGFLNEAIKEKGILEPNKIFDYVREKLVESISKDGQKDGFDGVLLCINTTTKQITYAAANNAPVLISNNNLIELEKDRMPVGKGEKIDLFSLFTVSYKAGDILYIYTDGYADQFGGPKGKKFKYKTLNDTLVQSCGLAMEKQSESLNQKFTDWKGKLEQVDDVCIIGIRL